MERDIIIISLDFWILAKSPSNKPYKGDKKYPSTGKEHVES